MQCFLEKGEEVAVATDLLSLHCVESPPRSGTYFDGLVQVDVVTFEGIPFDSALFFLVRKPHCEGVCKGLR
jgi:hypothetical protein